MHLVSEVSKSTAIEVSKATLALSSRGSTILAFKKWSESQPFLLLFIKLKVTLILRD